MAGSLSEREIEGILEEAIEELTIQNVVLDSMRTESWPGIELERQELTDKIDRLKDKIRRIRQGSWKRSDDAATLPGPSSGSNSAPIAGASSSKMSTSQGDERGWGTPRAVRSGKRNLHEDDSDSVDGRVKSRRATPIRHNGPVARSSGLGYGTRSFLNEPSDMIDLTGDDVDLDAYCVSQQLARAKQREQENEDRRLAMRLSSDQSRVGSSMTIPSSSNTESSQPSALSRLMETQRLNAGAPTDGPWFPSQAPTVLGSARRHPITPSTDPHGTQMPGPGVYSPRRDATLRTSLGTSPRHAPTVQTPSDSGRYLFGARSSQTSGPGVQPHHSQPALPPISPSFRPSSDYQGAVAAGSRYYQTPSMAAMAGPSGSSMSRIINKTSTFDFMRGIDVCGHPLEDRLHDFLSGDDDTSPATGQELDDLLKNIRPDIDIPEYNREVGPEGLKYPLYRHQGVALAWMKKMEEGTNKGGILADDMGLGKTISTLSLMLSNRAESRPKTNLIIGPLSLIRQWEEELMKKTIPGHRLSVFVHHGKKSTTEDLLKYDVVLTTYGTIASELKRLEQFMEENKDRNIDFNDRACSFKFPLLNPGKAFFHRIILDEAQCIKNRNTKTAKACHHLKATYRWCLTGTPMMNGVLELFSLLKFLQIKPYNSWERFRQAFGALFGQRGDPKSQAMDRLRALLKAVMLRRKKDSLLDGKPILELPPKTEHVVYAELSTDERDFYKQLEEKAQVLFSKYLREGSIGKNYSNILVLLLRLRQACCHPHLNLDVDDASGAVVGSDEDVEQPVRDLDKVIVERIRTLDNFECPICYDVVQSPLFFIPCGHDSCKDCLIRISDTAMSQNIQEGHESNTAKCPVCRGAFNPRKCFTYDLFRRIHMPESVEKLEAADSDASDAETESDSDESESDVDDEMDEVDDNGNLKDFIVDDDESEGKMEDNDEDGLDSLEVLNMKASLLERKKRNQQRKSELEKKKKKKKGKGKETMSNNKGKGKGKGKGKKPEVKPHMLKSLRLEAAKNLEAYKTYMQYLRKTWMPAAKVSECMRLLTEIGRSGDKTIIFSQWTLLLDLLEVAMWHEKFESKPLRYDGSMSGDRRSDAANTFRDDPKVKVMLVSLRAGNAGLNLTAANRVIIMDPFWNPYIEMQAIDRTYRIGQQREVQVYRILTKQTVEDRIVQLQDKKKEIVEAALDETESMKIGRLNVSELKFLFNTR
ncbi:hypothetical protein E4U17_002497 [Claviceps sp. LM77 group G4]|nr:hypothetical protein E4U33_000288 [Claviceps sp. LM78 group G4]KAG6056072.1 hypothetical protein E4U17_002497 [Claviceps sp. LM77 group G4]KAG6076377.1 hypothetical protein E4U16_002799 [Claviceps sp. LM84 group G4]